MNPVRRARLLLKEIEYRRARDSLAVYSGLHIPAVIEQDDLPGMEKLPIAARYIPAEHHRLIIEKLEALERGYVVEDGKQVPFKRLMIFAPPGSAKSSYASVLFPAWYLGRNPRDCLIQGSYNDTLASRFGRRARNAYASQEHFKVFGVGLGKSAEGDWETAEGGEYFSFGMKTGVTGRRADLVVIDDAIKGRKEADSPTERNNVWETYKADVRTRMKPGAAIVFICTRWHEDDPAGRILPPEALGKSGWFTALDGEEWYVISLNAVIETKEEAENDILGRQVGEILWPEWFTEKMLLQEKRTQGERNWASLYKQMPRPDEGGILKRTNWKRWGGSKPPKCEYVVSVYDTAFEEGEENDYSARTTWGIFWHEEDPPPMKPSNDPMAKWKVKPPPGGRYCAILLEAWEEKVEFPALRSEAKAHYRKFRPDQVLIEKKASGHSLLQELRKAQIPVKPLKADRSKLARAHAASVVLEDGCIYCMDYDRWPQFSWVKNVIDRCASFPTGRYNDIGDTCCHAWIFLRQRFRLTTKGDDSNDDEDDDSEFEAPKRKLFG